MGNVVSVSAGISVIGNTTDASVDIEAVGLNKVLTCKTLVNGQWKSWINGADNIFQGFNSMSPGNGYVVNTSESLDIEFIGNDININTLTLQPGLSLLAFPYDNKDISGKYIPRIKPKTMRTLVNGIWKSWDANAIDDFQGFLKIDKSLGYVVNVEKVYDTHLNKYVKDINTGVTIGLVSGVINNPHTAITDTITGLGILYKVISIDDSTSVSLPSVMTNGYFYIDGNVLLLEFPLELVGRKIVIRKTDTVIVDLGSLNNTTENEDYNQMSGQEDFGELTAVQSITTNEFTYIMNTNNDFANPIQPVEIVAEDIIEIMYDVTPYNSETQRMVMHMEIAGAKTRISFAEEYLGKDFVILYNNNSYQGTFLNTNTFTNIE